MITENPEEHYKWTYEENPLIPFNVRHQSERAKYLECITENVNIESLLAKNFGMLSCLQWGANSYLGRMHNPIVHVGLETYNLTNLTMIAAQYDKLKNATNALSKLGSMPNAGTLSLPMGDLNGTKKMAPFQIRKYCTPYK